MSVAARIVAIVYTLLNRRRTGSTPIDSIVVSSTTLARTTSFATMQRMTATVAVDGPQIGSATSELQPIVAQGTLIRGTATAEIRT